MVSKIIRVDVTPVVSTSPAYTSGDAVGGKMTFANLCDGGQAELIAIRLYDLGNQKAATDLLIFDQSFTATTDNAAIAVSAADLANLIGRISIATTDWTSVQSGRAEATKILAYPLPLVAAADNNIYAQMVTRGTPTYGTTADLQVRLFARITRGDW